MMKPYFCPNCGKSYSQKDCLINDGKMYCFDCPKTQLAFSGVPLMLIGAFFGVLFLLSYQLPANVQYGKWVFLLAACGLIFTGILRNQQASNALKNAESSASQTNTDDKQGPISQE